MIHPDELRRLAELTPIEELPRVVGVLHEALAVAQLRLAAPPQPQLAAAQEQPLAVDLPTAAKISGLPEDYLRTLTRQRRIPTVRPPSTKPGRAGGKYVRVLLADLRRFMGDHRDAGIVPKQA